MENELEVVNIRLVREPSLYSEQILDSPQAVVGSSNFRLNESCYYLQQPVDYPISAHYKEMVLLPDGYSQLPIHSPLF